MGEEPVIVSRTKDGSIHVVVNSCSHRGTRICKLDAGTATTLTCPYHGWQFGMDGRLLGVPSLRMYNGSLNKSERGLHKARVESYYGLIFATFDQGASPLTEYIGDEFRYYPRRYRRPRRRRDDRARRHPPMAAAGQLEDTG